MKKVAPPPPPVTRPPLSNGNVMPGRRASSAGEYPRPPPFIGEDCAFDELLEGRMDLNVVLPDLKVVRMTVDRRTPMMDILVQTATSNKISPSGHILNVISKDERNVSYKPNTPIGCLDASTVYIVPKSTLELPVKRMPKLANQPFEQQTFRLQVNLPRNQLMVLRVSPRITLSDLKSQICREKELDHSNHHLVHPAQPDTILDLNATLEVYGCAEISLMSNSGLRDSIRNTSTNIFPVPKIEEERKKKGILRLFSRKKKDFTLETTNGSNGIPTSHSENSLLSKNSYQPKQSIKRKPAPAPPPVRSYSPPKFTQSTSSLNSRPESEISVKTFDEVESTVSHSRHSSDSSGYHEPSVFSDCSENKSPEASIVHGDNISINDAIRQNSPVHKDYTENNVLKRSSMTAKDTNLKSVPSCSTSNVSIISASRKRKAPQPPASTLPAIESPSSPDANHPVAPSLPDYSPSSDAGESLERLSLSENSEHFADHRIAPTSDNETESRDSVQQESETESRNSVQQESEALQYLEDVLQESESYSRNFSAEKMADDSDTDSLKDEGEVISVCQAEVHANDQDSSDSIVEPLTIVSPDPALTKSSCVPLSVPNSYPESSEVVDVSADDSGISQSLNSDADSSVPSINSDLKTMSDSGCQEEIYCNVTDSMDERIALSSEDFLQGAPSNTDCNKIEETLENLIDSNAEVVANNEDSNKQLIQLGEDVESEQLETENVEVKKVFQNDSCTVKTPTLGPPIHNSEICTDNTNPSLSAEILDEMCENSGDRQSSSSSLSNDSTPEIVQKAQIVKKLDNFELGCYQTKDNIDIFSIPSPEHKVSNNDSDIPFSKRDVPKRKAGQAEVKIVSFKERNGTDHCSTSENKGSVLEKCAQLTSISTLPLTGRSASLFNLTPQKKYQTCVKEIKCLEEEVVNGNMKRTHSDQNIAQDQPELKDSDQVDLKETFLQEQKRLQEEYLRLQEQFISWQMQLMNNQNLLQSENIVPQMPFPSLGGLVSSDSTSLKDPGEFFVKTKSDTNINYDFKTKSLPRPKTKPLSVKEPDRSTTPPTAQSPTEASIVNVDSQEQVKRPETLRTRSVDTQATSNQEDKKTQIPSPQDKNTQVPSPQEKVTSGTQVPSPENVLNKDTSAQTSDIEKTSTDVSSNSLSSPESESSKSQTLPRPKPKPISALPQPSRTMTLNRNNRPKTQAVSVTIGSWQQRQPAMADVEPSGSVASTRSKFLSLENIPQGSVKPVSSSMEKRRLPPVPTESATLDKGASKTVPKFVEARTFVVNVPKKEEQVASTVPKSIEASISVKTVPKYVPTHHKTQPVLDEIKSETVDKKSPMAPSDNETEILKVAPKPSENAEQKQKMDVKTALKEAGTIFKLPRPFVKMTSMKDEPHTPSIIGLKKWPLGDNRTPAADSKQDMVDDLRASSKRPGGFMQEKIRRAEVDLRKPKSVKAAADTSTAPKPKTDGAETSKTHITKVSIKNNADCSSSSAQKATSPTSGTVVTGSHSKTNTIPKSQSLNSELMSVFSKKAMLKEERTKQNCATVKESAQTVTVNGSVQPCPPPPPPPPPQQTSISAMPTIPPAEQIPVSSQLLMARGTNTLPVTRKESKRSQSKVSHTAADPREELMLEIRGFGGKQALRKLCEKSLTLLKKSPKKKAPEETSSSSKQ